MYSVLRVLSVLGPLALLTVSAAAQSIDTVEPAEGTVGTVVTISGDGFGAAKPKAFLRDAGTGKKYALKVTSNVDGQLVAEVKKAVAGALDLVVQPKGKGIAEIVAEEGFIVRAPEIVALLDAPGGEPVTEANPGEEFTVVGSFFGPKKAKVRIGGKAAKVVEWEPGAPGPGDGGGATDSARIQMPKSLGNGLWDLVFDNKIGVDDSAEITMVGSTKKLGKLKLDISIGGEKVNFKIGKPENVPDAGTFVLVGTTATNPSKSINIIVPFDILNDEAPATLVAGALEPLLVTSYLVTGKVTLKQIQQGNFGGIATYGAGLGGGALTIEITASSGGQVAGTITGTLAKMGDTFQPPTQPATLAITGSFLLQP